jgi:hypothetical protein
MELISKQYPDSVMEYAMRMLHDEKYAVQNLSKASILGSKLPVVKSTINDAEIESFVKNCIQDSQGIQQTNVKQKAAIQRAFKNDLTLIQGPSGTSKTVCGIILAHCFTQLNKKKIVWFTARHQIKQLM